MPTGLGPVTRPDAVLCRTDVGAMAQVMELLSDGHRVAPAGGGDSLRALALAAHDLKEGRRTIRPELVLFTTWGDLQDCAACNPDGRDLQPLVDLVDTHGADAVLAAVAHLAPEDQAEATVSTAHKAKGRERAQVKIADDFTPPSDGPPDGTGQETPPDRRQMTNPRRITASVMRCTADSSDRFGISSRLGELICAGGFRGGSRVKGPSEVLVQ